MTTSVLLYVDFNASSGLGHVSRAEAFFEAISTDQNKVYISSEKDTDRLKPNFNFLKNVTWIDFQEAKQMDFDIAYLDTYSNATINEFKEISAIKKILLIDSNFNDEIPNWANLVIVLEQANVRNSNHKALLVYGLTLISSHGKNTTNFHLWLKRSLKSHGTGQVSLQSILSQYRTIQILKRNSLKEWRQDKMMIHLIFN